MISWGFYAYGAGVVLSDTALNEENDAIAEETFIAPKSEPNYTYTTSKTNSYIGQQPTFHDLLSNDTSDPLFLTTDNNFLSDTYI